MAFILALNLLCARYCYTLMMVHGNCLVLLCLDGMCEVFQLLVSHVGEVDNDLISEPLVDFFQ